MLSLFINWDISPEIFNLGGISIRYYGLLFAVAFILGYKVEEKMFKSEGLPMAWLDKLWLYVAIATIVGARLGHCIFYDWAYYSQHPLEMILPVRFSPKSIFWILDRAVIPIALAGFFIRTGNLMNSEIVGLPTNMPWGFRFMNSDLPNPELPRHPAQLYEAICYLFSFFVLMYLYWRTNVKKKMGFIFGAFLILIFSARFIIEFVKEVQEPWEAGMALNMGQILSIPFILAGIFMLWYSKKLPDEGEKKGKKGKG